jgi:hypothetical protein
MADAAPHFGIQLTQYFRIGFMAIVGLVVEVRMRGRPVARNRQLQMKSYAATRDILKRTR